MLPDKEKKITFQTLVKKQWKTLDLDHTTKSSNAVYWIDDFLKLRARGDSYGQATGMLSAHKNFISKAMDQGLEVTPVDKIDLMNRSMKYFKEHDQFDFDEFSNNAIVDSDAIESFRKFKQEYE